MGAKFYHYAQSCSNSQQAALYPTKGERQYFLLENRGAASVYINFDRAADANDGVEVPPGGIYELERVAPNNIIYIGGTISTPQRVNITEAF